VRRMARRVAEADPQADPACAGEDVAPPRRGLMTPADF